MCPKILLIKYKCILEKSDSFERLAMGKLQPRGSGVDGGSGRRPSCKYEDSGVSPPRSDHCPYQSPPSKASLRLCPRSRSSSGSSSCRSRSPATRRTFRYGWVGGLRMDGGQLSTPSSEVSGERGALRPGPQLPVRPVSWSEALEVDS